jgi:hypothetical protein
MLLGSRRIAHRFLHERADPCLIGGGQLLQREAARLVVLLLPIYVSKHLCVKSEVGRAVLDQPAEISSQSRDLQNGHRERLDSLPLAFQRGEEFLRCLGRVAEALLHQ